MNDEYLWQKTGEDPDVEKLENVLAVFRYRETAPPVSATSRAAVTEEVPRWRISWAFAFSASLAAVSIIAVVVWFQISARNSASANPPEVVFVAGPESHEASFPNTESEPKTPAVQTGEIPLPRMHGRRDKVNPTTASVGHKVKAKDAAAKDSIAALTEEERYAYRQLMLALSISSSKLKIVQDTINGTKETEIPGSTNQR